MRWHCRTTWFHRGTRSCHCCTVQSAGKPCRSCRSWLRRWSAPRTSPRKASDTTPCKHTGRRGRFASSNTSCHTRRNWPGRRAACSSRCRPGCSCMRSCRIRRLRPRHRPCRSCHNSRYPSRVLRIRCRKRCAWTPGSRSGRSHTSGQSRIRCRKSRSCRGLRRARCSPLPGSSPISLGSSKRTPRRDTRGLRRKSFRTFRSARCWPKCPRKLRRTRPCRPDNDNSHSRRADRSGRRCHIDHSAPDRRRRPAGTRTCGNRRCGRRSRCRLRPRRLPWRHQARNRRSWRSGIGGRHNPNSATAGIRLETSRRWYIRRLSGRLEHTTRTRSPRYAGSDRRTFPSPPEAR